MKNYTKITAIILAAVILLSLSPIFGVRAEAMYENTWTNTGNVRADLVGVAKTQVGYIEVSYNHTKFGADFGMNGQAWCALFVWWCCHKAEVPGLPMTASCSGLRDGFIKSGAVWHSVDSGYAPRKGDIVFFTTTLTTGIGHSGIVREDSPAEGPILTIEGNTSNPYRDTLDGVFAKSRPLKGSVVSVYGYISLTDVPADEPEEAVEVTEEIEYDEPEESEEVYEETEEVEEPAEEPVEESAEETEEVKHGWIQEDGVWRYYDFEGVMLKSDWAPTTYGWRWLNESGELDGTVWADEEWNVIYV